MFESSTSTLAIIHADVPGSALSNDNKKAVAMKAMEALRLRCRRRAKSRRSGRDRRPQNKSPARRVWSLLRSQAPHLKELPRSFA